MKDVINFLKNINVFNLLICASAHYKQAQTASLNAGSSSAVILC